MDKRRPFQGVLNILSFNRHYYFWGLALLVLLFASLSFFVWPPLLFWIIVTGFIYGLIMPLLVSAYVYDLSGFYNFKWLEKIYPDRNRVNKIVNINAGFDETSFILQSKFPSAQLQVFDFYDAKHHTEPAIKRARTVSLEFPNNTQIESSQIPLAENSVDIVFLLSAVHEIRSQGEKIIFLKECYRVCKENGEVVMVEHLRDFPNFLAFTVGFTHFFSRSTWKSAFTKAGFQNFEEIKFTPFMSIFRCRR